MKEFMDGRNRADRIIHSLDLPGQNPCIEIGIPQRKEELGIVIHCMVIARRDKLAKDGPVAGRQFGSRSISPIFRDRFLAVRQVRTDAENLLRLDSKLR